MMNLKQFTIKIVLILPIIFCIDQQCPCNLPNSYCNDNNYCACDNGFILNCSTPARILDSNNATINSVITGQYTYFNVIPVSLNTYITFTLTIYQNLSNSIGDQDESILKVRIWGNTGTIDELTSRNSILRQSIPV